MGERLLTMLKLAEQEAEEIVEQGHQRAAANTADLQASLERRETEVAEAHGRRRAGQAGRPAGR